MAPLFIDTDFEQETHQKMR